MGKQVRLNNNIKIHLKWIQFVDKVDFYGRFRTIKIDFSIFGWKNIVNSSAKCQKQVFKGNRRI